MNHKEKLLEIYLRSNSITDVKNIDSKTLNYIDTIGINIEKQKGVFTVLITLITHKILFPEQDIRYHQANLNNGLFSGRSIDTNYITPTLKELGLTSMAESGWLTRSLEQPYPFLLDYNGKISNLKVKEAFLNILDYIQKHPKKSTNILRFLLHKAIRIKEESKIKIIPLENPEILTIERIINVLEEHFKTNYKTHGGSKLPVLAFYAIYECITKELLRYKNSKLCELGSHTASDRNSKSAGDIEITIDNKIYEVIEIKLDKLIDQTTLRVAIEKIKIFNPARFYILSYKGINEEDKLIIAELIDEIREQHGCQIIVNGIIPSLKYYLRLISSLDIFINNYSKLIQNDKELQQIHKNKWNELISTILNKNN